MDALNFVNQKASVIQEQVASGLHSNGVKIPKFK
jgi:hypothetical protein